MFSGSQEGEKGNLSKKKVFAVCIGSIALVLARFFFFEKKESENQTKKKVL